MADIAQAVKLKELAKVRLSIQTYKEMLDLLEYRPCTYSQLARAVGYSPQHTSFYKIYKAALDNGFIVRYDSTLYLKGSPLIERSFKDEIPIEIIELLTQEPLSLLANHAFLMANLVFERPQDITTGSKQGLITELWRILNYPANAEKVLVALLLVAIATENPTIYNKIKAKARINQPKTLNVQLIAQYLEHETSYPTNHSE